MSSAPLDYTKLPESESDLETRSHISHSGLIISAHKHKNTLIYRLALCISVNLVFFFALIVVASVLLSPRDESVAPTPDIDRYDCGNSTSTATAANCEFDLLTYSYLPKPCIDRQTSMEFKEWLLSGDRAYSSWPFYADPEGREKIPDEEALSKYIGSRVWTTQEEHLGHCIFLMRRYHKIPKERFTSFYLTYEHAVHCSNEILWGLKGGRRNGKENVGLTSYFQVGFDDLIDLIQIPLLNT
ncbi:hypothetical protein PVAG01_08719 [Phlyctema vagabunda]|uniref:Uncharacterized protein n=1 Tax=Phlyctema vagabunda TaxID=108571 RepID=A0ABR4PA82_9HELO